MRQVGRQITSHNTNNTVEWQSATQWLLRLLHFPLYYLDNMFPRRRNFRCMYFPSKPCRLYKCTYCFNHSRKHIWIFQSTNMDISEFVQLMEHQLAFMAMWPVSPWASLGHQNRYIHHLAHLLTAVSLCCHLQVNLLRAGAYMELTFTAIRVAISATHWLSRGHTFGRAHTPSGLGLADGSELTFFTAICNQKYYRGSEKNLEISPAALCMSLVCPPKIAQMHLRPL